MGERSFTAAAWEVALGVERYASVTIGSLVGGLVVAGLWPFSHWFYTWSRLPVLYVCIVSSSVYSIGSMDGRVGQTLLFSSKRVGASQDSHSFMEGCRPCPGLGAEPLVMHSRRCRWSGT